MMGNEKIKEIFYNIIELILKTNEINRDHINDLNKRLYNQIETIYKHIFNINNSLSKYEVRKDLDLETETKRIEELRDLVNMEKQKTEKIRSEFDFNISQNYLKLKDINELTEGIRHLIDEL